MQFFLNSIDNTFYTEPILVPLVDSEFILDMEPDSFQHLQFKVQDLYVLLMF